MKVNVNEYNEILNYEGTPEEIAELVKLGVFGEWVPVEEMVECGYNDEYEDCNCENNEEIVPEDFANTEEATDEISEIELPDMYEYTDECKEQVRKQIKLLYPEISDEDFEKYYTMVADWAGSLSKLFS
jgi:hypothetical protein